MSTTFRLHILIHDNVAENALERTNTWFQLLAHILLHRSFGILFLMQWCPSLILNLWTYNDSDHNIRWIEEWIYLYWSWLPNSVKLEKVFSLTVFCRRPHTLFSAERTDRLLDRAGRFASYNFNIVSCYLHSALLTGSLEFLIAARQMLSTDLSRFLLTIH